jgi:hypothetical protein
LDKAFREATKVGAEALVILPNAAFVPNLKRIADYSLQARLNRPGFPGELVT